MRKANSRPQIDETGKGCWSVRSEGIRSRATRAHVPLLLLWPCELGSTADEPNRFRPRLLSSSAHPSWVFPLQSPAAVARCIAHLINLGGLSGKRMTRR